MPFWRMLAVRCTYTLAVLACIHVHVVVSDCPLHLNNTTVVVGEEGQPKTLQDALLSLQAPSSANCTRIQLSTGIHHLTQAIHTQQNVVIERHPDSYNDTQPVVRCTDDFEVEKEAFAGSMEQRLATVSFKDVLYVEISGILFEYCPLPLQFLDVKLLRIEQSIFRYFNDTPVAVYNCDTVEVVGSEFLNNSAHGPLYLPFRIKSGGIAYTSFNETKSVNASLWIANCVFTNNSVLQSAAYDSTQSVQLGIFQGQGGGIGAVLSFAENVDILVENCTFKGNMAQAFGGGLYINTLSGAIHHHYSIVNCTFLENVVGMTGGGFGLSFFPVGAPHTTNQIQLRHAKFVRNRAEKGGAMYIFQGEGGGLGNDVLVEDCEFVANEAPEHGSAVFVIPPLQSYFTFGQSRKTVFRNNVFQGNIGTRLGTLSTYERPLSLEGDNTFIDNRGCGLRVSQALVDVEGSLSFINNTVFDSGTLSLSSFGQLRLHSGAALLFEGNMGGISSAIEVEPLFGPQFVLGSTLCFLQYEDPRLEQSLWNVSVIFEVNTALVGSAIFTKFLKSCASSGDNLDTAFRTSQFQYISNTNTALLDPHNARFDISTPQVDFSVSTSSEAISVFPGESFNITVTSVNELGDPAEGVYRIEEASNSLKNLLSLHPSSVHSFPNSNETKFQLSLHQRSYVTNSNHTFTFTSQGQNSRFVGFFMKPITVTLKGCPPGRALSSLAHNDELFHCSCDRDNDHILSCEPNGNDVVLKDNLWGVSSVSQSEGRHNDLHAYTCPQGYCRCTMATITNSDQCSSLYQSNDTDAQCTCYRTGYLCGSCSNGTGVTALLDRCEHCSPLNGLLIAALVIVDTIVILSVMMVSLWKPLHLPSWMYSIIFYIQIVPFTTRHLMRPFWTLHTPMFYLGSLLGLYFPYDFCLYPNATAVEVYAIKYIPFILASIICPSVIVAANCRGIKVNYSGVWLILMLLFNQVVYTSASVLNCPMMRDENGAVNMVWFVDGTVKCFTGGHIPLALWAIFCLILFVAAVFAPLMCYVTQKEVPVNILRLWKAVTIGYREKYKWWYCIELGRRLIVVVVIVAFPGKVIPPLCLLVVYYAVYSYVCPYCSALANTLEVVLLGSFIVLLHIPFLPLSSSYHVTTTNTCGHPVLSTNDASRLMAALYYCTIVVSVVAMVMTVCVKKFNLKAHLLEWMSKQLSPNSQTHQESFTESLLRYTTADVDLTEPAVNGEKDDFDMNDHHELREL